MNQSDDLDPKTDKSLLEVWAAYLPGEGNERKYLSNGKQGNAHAIRLFKSEQAAWNYLKEQLEYGLISIDAYSKIIVHAVEGKLALPAELEPQQPKKLPTNKVPFRLMPPNHLKPIITLHKPSVPTVVELLDDYQRRHKKRRRRN